MNKTLLIASDPMQSSLSDNSTRHTHQRPGRHPKQTLKQGNNTIPLPDPPLPTYETISCRPTYFCSYSIYRNRRSAEYESDGCTPRANIGKGFPELSYLGRDIICSCLPSSFATSLRIGIIFHCISKLLFLACGGAMPFRVRTP